MKIRPEIAAMEGYTPGEQPADISQWVKLNTNENPYPPSPRVRETLRTFDVDRLRRYPNACSDALRTAIAQRYNFARENVLIGNGSDDVLNLIMRLFAAPDNTVGVINPSYSLYPVLAKLQSAQTCAVELNDDFSIPDDFCQRVKACAVVLIPAPNAPTGTPFTLEKLREIAAGISGALVIDEAYADFSGATAMELVREFKNVLISRTFSKSYALAGLRVGYVIADAALINELIKVKDSYNVDAVAQQLALTAFEDRDYLQSTLKLICEERARTVQRLEERGFTVCPSQANFLFASPPDRNGRALYDYLKSHHILVRYFDAVRTAPYVRITIGTAAQMDRLFAALDAKNV